MEESFERSKHFALHTRTWTLRNQLTVSCFPTDTGIETKLLTREGTDAIDGRVD